MTQAATPNWSMVITQEPPSMAAGGEAGFQVSITNNGPSNIAQLFYVDSPKGAAAFTNDSRCTKSPDFKCTLGSLAAGATVTFKVSYGPISGSTFEYRGQINANGATFSDRGNTSRGDALSYPSLDPFQAPLSTSVCSNKHCAGGFLKDGGDIANDTNLQQNKNRQSTQLFGIAVQVGAYVEDGPDVQTKYAGVCTTPGITCGSTGKGEWSVVIYDNGRTQTGAFKLVMTTLGTFTASDLTTPVDHAVSDAAGVVQSVDQIATICALDTNGQPVAPPTPESGACFYSRFLGNQNNPSVMQTTVWTFVNGPMRK
jgi:hypothetical protein